jgi:hypothetical protein
MTGVDPKPPFRLPSAISEWGLDAQRSRAFPPRCSRCPRADFGGREIDEARPRNWSRMCCCSAQVNARGGLGHAGAGLFSSKLHCKLSNGTNDCNGWKGNPSADDEGLPPRGSSSVERLSRAVIVVEAFGRWT